ncbi:DNA methylase family protein [Corynebacterium simulans]|uniref:site-specific DNA-methyltransferase n=1 Tax=Corynebacterium TaxID=1716 RepID=UPI000783AF06|nr:MULTISPECIES: site-specific DNA-methyltransferase [Corynebacterium]AMO87795.1 DNA methylase family protein [Corynebacterium simulans]OFT48328.1 DNA methyltransferase [Corynebacterium sp. HMSC06G04]
MTSTHSDSASSPTADFQAQEEFFGLVWPGKAQAAEQAKIATTKQKIAVSTPAACSNSIVEGDNLDALKLMVADGFAADVIYIDPPYNTGKDFVYKDNYRKRRKMNSGSYSGWHAQWLSMMLPRLILARQVLKDTGFIFVSIGEDESANVRKVLDEIFGENCFAGQLIWKKGGTGKNDSKYAVVEHEYILVYAKSPANPGFNADSEGHTTTKYNFSDEKGNYSLVRLDSKTLGYLPSLDFPIADPQGREYWPDQPAGKDKVARWRWGKDKVEANYEQLVFRRGFVYTKNYQKKGARPRSILDGERFGVTRAGRRDAEDVMGVQGVFDFPKPVRLIKHLIAIADGPDAVVLDFFAGSGTTAQAVLELNSSDGGSRSFHLVQMPQPTDSKGPAFAAGYKTVADICVSRVAAVPNAKFAHYVLQD